MNTALWIVQGLLAAAFVMAGIMKSTQPIEKLSKQMPWVGQVPEWQVRLVGVSEFLGAVGLIVPWLTGIAPILTPIAAVALGLVMILAAIHHIQHDGGKGVPFNAVFLLMTAFVAYGRFMI